MTTTVQNARAVTAEISTLIANSSSTVRGAYVKGEVDKEIKSRTEVFTKAMEKLSSLQGELKKIKPQVLGINIVKVEGQPDQEQKMEAWKPEDLKKKKELGEKIQKLGDAITGYLSYVPPGEGEEPTDPNKDPYKVLKDTLNKMGQDKPQQTQSETD